MVVTYFTIFTLHHATSVITESIYESEENIAQAASKVFRNLTLLGL